MGNGVLGQWLPPNQVLPPFNPPGHYAPDEVPGAKAVLHEHQLGAGELQQVGAAVLWAPSSKAILRDLAPTSA